MLFRLKSITLSAQNSSCTIQRWRMRFRLFISPHFSGRQIEVYSVCLLVIWIYDPLVVVTLQNCTNWFTAPCKFCFPILLFSAKKIYSKVLSLFINTCLTIAYNSAFVQNYRFENTKVVMCLSCMFLFKRYPTYLFITLTLYKDKGTNLLINYLYSSYIFSKIGKVFC